MNFLRACFGFRGRLNRTQYAIVLGVVCIAPMLVLFEMVSVPRDEVLLPILGLVNWVLFASLVKRFHDVDWSGPSCLLVLVPGIGMLVPFAMLFWRGTEGENRYGYQQSGLF